MASIKEEGKNHNLASNELDLAADINSATALEASEPLDDLSNEIMIQCFEMPKIDYKQTCIDVNQESNEFLAMIPYIYAQKCGLCGSFTCTAVTDKWRVDPSSLQMLDHQIRQAIID